MIKRRVKISSFLTEREDRFKPDKANKLGLMRVNKIDFSGKIHLVEHKPTRTNMILVKKGDLLISGINAEKGAVAIYEYDEDAIATIHYSSYSYDKEKINIEYLKWYLKSNTFKNILIEQAGNGIKSELKAKKFLKLVIDLPELTDQIEFVSRMASVNQEIVELNKLMRENESLLSQLRQSILQDAIQGELTKKWREQNSDVEPASELLKRIQTEKEQLIKEKKIKKENPLPKIKADEIPFEIPESWEWCRFQEIFDVRDGTHDSPKQFKGSNSYQLVTSKNFKNGEIDFESASSISKDDYLKIIQRSGVEKDDILFSMIGGNIGNQVVVGERTNFAIKNVALFKFYNRDLTIPNYLFLFSKYIGAILRSKATGGAQPFVSLSQLRSLLIPLMTVQEQFEITKRVNELNLRLDSIQFEIEQSKMAAELLIEAVLSELLGEENTISENPKESKETKKTEREIKYDSKTILMELVKLLEKHGCLHAEDLWKMSKFPEDIDKFYAELKKQIEQEKTIKESTEKGYLELA